MSDIFKEVDEDLEREKIATLWKRYQTPVYVAAFLILVATAAYNYFETSRRKLAEAAGARFEAASALAREGKTKEAIAAFEAMGNDAAKGYATLARLRAAEELAATDKEKAVALLDALAEDKAVDRLTQEVARLRAAVYALEAGDRVKLEERLGPLMGSANPFRFSAQEWNALDALGADDFDEAERVFDILLNDREAPQSMRQRAAAYRGLLHAKRGPKKKDAAESGSPSGVTITPVIEPADGGGPPPVEEKK
jgi:hypothetical protein